MEKPDPIKKLQELSKQYGKSGFPEQKETKEEFVSLDQAREIMGDHNFLGPEDIRTYLQLDIKDIDVPRMRFTRKELEQAKKDDQELVLYLDQFDGKPATAIQLSRHMHEHNLPCDSNITQLQEYRNLSEPCRNVWRLSSKNILLGSEKKDFVYQTEWMIAYLKAYFGGTMPDTYISRVDEFEKEKESINAHLISPIKYNKEMGAHRFSKLMINKLCRENVAELFYRMVLHKRKTGESICHDYALTNSYLNEDMLIVVKQELSGFIRLNGHGSNAWANGVCLSLGK